MKTEEEGNSPGVEGILDIAQVCSAGGHSKRTWWVNSSSTLHMLHLKSQSIPRDFRFLVTGSVPDNICHTKCFSFGGHFNFHEKANKGWMFGPKVIVLCLLSENKVFILKPNLTEYLPGYVKFQPYESGLWSLLIVKPLIILTSSECMYTLNKSTFHERSVG